MKHMVKTLVLVLLLTVIGSAAYIAAVAAEDPTARQQSVTTFDYGVALPRESRGESDLENAPALRLDSQVVVPQLPPEPADIEAEGYLPPPDTGAASDTLQILGALALLGASLWMASGRKLPAA